MLQEKPEEGVSKRTSRKRKRKSQKAERKAKRLRNTNEDSEVDVWGIFTSLRTAEESRDLKKVFDENPMNFWKRHSVSKLQKLFRIAKRVYCIPSSSTSSERVTYFHIICRNPCYEVFSLSKRNFMGNRGNKKYGTHEKEVIIGSYLRMLRQGL